MDNRFVFVAPAYNAEKTVERMLMSIFLQTYDNWLVLIRDDMSTNNDTIRIIQDVCIRNKVPLRVRETVGLSEMNDIFPPLDQNRKVIVDANHEKFWEVKNVLAMINDPVVKETDIICRIDSDDFLCDICALQDINQVYNQTLCDALWTKHRWGDSLYNISGPMPDDADPYKHPWVSSHLKTFRKHLITGVDDENFRGEDGEYIKRTGDQAIYLPVLALAKKRVFFPKLTYYYTIDMSPETFQTEDAKFQRGEGEFLRRRGFVGDRQ